MPGKVVLVHGIWDRGGIFDRLVKALCGLGFECHAPDFKPASAALGINDLAEKLAQYVATTFNSNESFYLIGFSMGGIVSRCYLQHPDHRKRVLALITVASPHQGTLWANLAWKPLFGKGIAEMRPGSDLLTQLDAQKFSQAIPQYAFWSPFDLVVFPGSAAIWRQAKNTRTNSLWHASFIRNRELIAEVVETLTGLERNVVSAI